MSKNYFDMSFSIFLSLPVEIQLNVLLQQDIETLGRLCRGSKYVQILCEDERLWKRKFINLMQSESSVFDETFIRLGSTWKDRTKSLWNILHPRKIYTVVVNELDTKLNDEHGHSNMTAVHKVLGNFLVDSIDHAEQCVLHAYKNTIEPIYSVIHAVVKDNPDRVGLVVNNDLKQLLADSNLVLMIYQNILFDSGSGSETFNLLSYDQFEFNVLFTVKGSNKEQVYNYLSAILNLYRYPAVSDYLQLPSLDVMTSEKHKLKHPLRKYYSTTIYDSFSEGLRDPVYVLPINYIFQQFVRSVIHFAESEFKEFNYKTTDIKRIFTHMRCNVDYFILQGKILPCSPIILAPLAPLSVPFPPSLTAKYRRFLPHY